MEVEVPLTAPTPPIPPGRVTVFAFAVFATVLPLCLLVPEICICICEIVRTPRIIERESENRGSEGEKAQKSKSEPTSCAHS